MTKEERAARVAELRRQVAAMRRQAPMFDSDSNLKGPVWGGEAHERFMRARADEAVREKEAEIARLLADDE